MLNKSVKTNISWSAFKNDLSSLIGHSTSAMEDCQKFLKVLTGSYVTIAVVGFGEL